MPKHYEKREAALQALAAKRGEKDPKSLRGREKELFDQKSEAELERLASPPKSPMPPKETPAKE